MDANFGLVHKMHSGCGPGLEHAKFNVFCPDDDVKTFVDSHHQATSKSGSPSVVGKLFVIVCFLLEFTRISSIRETMAMGMLSVFSGLFKFPSRRHTTVKKQECEARYKRSLWCGMPPWFSSSFC